MDFFSKCDQIRRKLHIFCSERQTHTELFQSYISKIGHYNKKNSGINKKINFTAQ